MKDQNKRLVATIVLVVIVLVIIACAVYVYTNQKAGTPAVPEQNNSQVNQNSNSNSNSTSKTYTTSDFSVTYPGGTYVEVQVNKSLPPTYSAQYSGMKLISSDRAGLIGKKQCSYGASGLTSVCTPDKEGGIAFLIINQSVSNLTSGLTPSLKTTQIISGKQAVVWKIGAEGEGADYYYVPINENKTLLINRLYRIVPGNTYEIFPTDVEFNQILSTVVVK